MNQREEAQKIILLNAKNAYPNWLPLKVLEAIRLQFQMKKETFYDIVKSVPGIEITKVFLLGEGGVGAHGHERIVGIKLTSHQTIKKNLNAPGARS